MIFSPFWNSVIIVTNELQQYWYDNCRKFEKNKHNLGFSQEITKATTYHFFMYAKITNS